MSIVHVDDAGTARVTQHAARRRRAARHRLRAARSTTARSSPPRTADRTRRTIRTCSRPGVRAAPTSGSSTRTTSARRRAARALTKLTLFADTPRALAVIPRRQDGLRGRVLLGQPDHRRVARTPSARSTASVHAGRRRGHRARPAASVPQPNTGLIVKWKLGPGRQLPLDRRLRRASSTRSSRVQPARPGRLRDRRDGRTRPAAKATGVYAHVGTTLFNMAVNPRNGKVYVSNTDAHNDVRFEGHTPGFTSVAGNIVDSRISVIDPASGAVTADNLNPHLEPRRAGTSAIPTLSRAFPQDLTFSRDGKTLYVVAQGSSKLAVYDTAALEAGIGAPTRAEPGGPVGAAARPASSLDEAHGVAFVLTRFDDGISVVDLARATRDRPRARCSTPSRRASPPAASTSTTRRITSALGDQACASCHIGGDFDGLAWDLGNPGQHPAAHHAASPPPRPTSTPIPEAFIAALIGAQQAGYIYGFYQPVQGPDDDAEPARPRQRTARCTGAATATAPSSRPASPFLDGNGNPVVSAQPNSGIFDEFNAFKSFNVAFPGLVGDAAQLSDADMSGVRDLHAADHLSAEPDPRPRRLADARRSRRARPSSSQTTPAAASCRSTASTTATAATRSTATATPAQRRTRASSAPTAGSRSRTSRRPSRCRTCATRTRSSACSARRSTRCTPSGSLIPQLNPPVPARARLRLPARRRRRQARALLHGVRLRPDRRCP